MERYLEGEEISHDEIVDALKHGVTEGRLFPVTCGIATKNLAVEPPARRDRRGPALTGEDGRAGGAATRRSSRPRTARLVAFVFKTLADPFAGRINHFRVYQGVVRHDNQLLNCRTHQKERIGQLLMPQGKETEQADDFGPGDIGAVAKLKDTHAGDVLAARATRTSSMPLPPLPAPVMAFAIEAEGEGRRGQGRSRRCGGCRRRTRRSTSTATTQTGEQIVAGLTQIHVEVIVGRLKERFGVEVELKPPRVPYRETIKAPAQGARALQEADRRPRPVRRLPHRDRAARRTARASSS